MSDIQNISITSTQKVEKPKPHTTYTIQISTPTRTWTVDRRYNDFLALHSELNASTGKEPPGQLPSKHVFSFTRSVSDDKIVRERRVLLETYLRTILTTKDARWRQSYGFKDFLAVPNLASTSSASNPTSTNSSGISEPPQQFTIPNWLIEHGNIQSLLRQTRSSLLKRDALALQMSDPSGARSANVEAKRYLKDVGVRLEGLEKGLKGLIGSGLGEGERKRREEMVENLKAERGNLLRMAEAGVRTSSAFTSSTSTSTSPTNPMPGGSSSLFANTTPTGRVFGSKPQETEITRPLDDRQVLQLQQTQIANQDGQLGELSRLLQNQRKMGELIGGEIERQNEELEEIDREVGRVGGKLGRAKREMNRLG